MPAWITITLADLVDARVAELIDACRREALGAGQGDPMLTIIPMVVDEVRRCIAFNPGTPLDATLTTIPAGLKELTVQKIVRLLKGRLQQPMTDDEVKAEALYQKRLEQLTRGEWPVDKPDTALTTATVERGGATQIINSGRSLNSHALDGL